MPVAAGASSPAPAPDPHLAGLLWTLVRTDFKSRYHGSLGGFLWALAKPAAMFVVLMTVFSLLFAGNPDYRLELIVGLFLWDFFAEGTRVGLASLHAKSHLLTRARIPPWVIVVASGSNAVITLCVFGTAVWAYLALAGRTGLGGALMLGVYAVHLWVIVLGFSLASSVLFLRFRDLNQVWEVVSQAGFFLAPVVWPFSILPERVHFWFYLWPPTPVIQFARAVLIDGQLPSWRAHALLAGLALVTLALGIAVYRRRAPRALEML